MKLRTICDLGFLSLLLCSCDSREVEDESVEAKDQPEAGANSRVNRELSGSDPEAERKFHDKLAHPEDLEEFLLEHLWENEAMALKSLGRFQGNADYDRIREILLKHFEEAGFEKGIKQFHLLEPNHTLAIPLWGQLLAKQWDVDPELALASLLKREDFRGSANAAKILGEQMGSSEMAREFFDQALAVETLDGMKKNLLQGIAQNWVKQDFEGAFQRISQVEPDPVIDETFYQLVAAGSTVDAGGTMPWALSIKNPGLQRSAILETALMWQATDNDAYLDWKKSAEVPADLMKELP